jgi:NuA3 HAT complex component NTO1
MDGVQRVTQSTQFEAIPSNYLQETQSIANGDVRKPASPSRRKKNSPKKTPWKLPSGTPVIPHVIFHNVVSSLAPLNLRNCEAFVAEVCKYWALKREARKGAPLIKRFQSQMDTFPSMEVTRRNYAQMVGGREKLLTRTKFAGDLQKHLAQVVVICEGVTEREMKMKEMATIMHGFVTKVYLPENELLWPILEAAQS